MMEEIPKAAVVITNPTSLAIALRYEKGMRAPVVGAKGAGFLAEQIRKVARKHGVPIVENRSVARMLYNWRTLGGNPDGVVQSRGGNSGLRISHWEKERRCLAWDG